MITLENVSNVFSDHKFDLVEKDGMTRLVMDGEVLKVKWPSPEVYNQLTEMHGVDLAKDVEKLILDEIRFEIDVSKVGIKDAINRRVERLARAMM
ncbi:MAG: hypothetical protein KY428_07320 [Bacteroidetes bacterium]|nr:hypothetical protein [Bacteroidota bacterium]